MKFVALGMAAEIIVVVEDQDALRLAQRSPPEMRCGQSGNAATHHHQIIVFAAVHGADRSGKTAIARVVRCLETARILPAQARARRGVQRRIGRG